MNKRGRVTLQMTSPVIMDSYATLDGVIGWCLVQEETAAGRLRDYDLTLDALPIAKHRFGDTYFYRASSWFLDTGAFHHEYLTHCNKRFNTERALQFLPTLDAKISHKEKHDKSYHVPHYPAVIEKMHFLFEGDIPKVERLLKTWLKAIGKKVGIGYGMIKSTTVQPDDRDPVLFTDGAVRRPLPVDADNTLRISTGRELTAIYAYRPPYGPYHPERRAICFMPDKKRLLGQVQQA